MYFQILKLVLWPKSGEAPRIVSFEQGVVNVISGASKTGKSAVIPIVDYCLGADKCSIPVGVIRESCEWFGVLIDTVEGDKLLARREPGDRQTTGDMFVVEGAGINIPELIEGKNANVDSVKAMLNRLAGLSNLDFAVDGELGFKSRPSFRDLMAFTFQPQNVVANPNVLFFKADTTEHREKLKTIFPYVLGAITPEILRSRQELDQVRRSLAKKEAELKRFELAAENWRLEAKAWLQQAIELGLLPPNDIPDDWSAILDSIRSITSKSARVASPTIGGINKILDRLEELRYEESAVALRLTESRRRLNELRRLREGGEAYGGAIRLQRDRLAISQWLRSKVSATSDPMASVASDEGAMDVLCNRLAELEVQLRSYPALSDSLDKELLRQRELTEKDLERLGEVRGEIATYEAQSEEGRESAFRAASVERFIGRLEQALRIYDQSDLTSPLRAEVDELLSRMDQLQKAISEADVRRRLAYVLSQLQVVTTSIVSGLDAEWPDAPVRLILEDLTVKVVRENRDDYLWEIGSGANWLAYHVATTLALQRYFLSQPHHPVPGLLVYDQPSQVYFPKRAALRDSEVEGEEFELRDEDVQAVRKVFMVLGETVARAKSRLQIIVLDHADEDVWGGVQGVHLVEEWRGDNKLVPLPWLAQKSDGDK